MVLLTSKPDSSGVAWTANYTHLANWINLSRVVESKSAGQHCCNIAR